MAQLSPENLVTFRRLEQQLLPARTGFELDDRYYDGAQRLALLGLAIPPELQGFTVIVNWPRVVVDARADRLDVKGFRLPGSDTGDADLYALWQANDMDEQDILARLDYQIHGRSYLCVGVNPDPAKDPVITAESPRQVITERDPRSRQVTAAVRLYTSSDDPSAMQDDRATFYTPNVTYWLNRDGAAWEIVDEPNDHGLGRVPVVPSFRGRRAVVPAHLTVPIQGTSAMWDVIPITDAAARSITNLQVAQEAYAVPARWAIGVSKSDFVGTDGAPLPVWEAYFGAISATANKDAKFGQFAASELTAFENVQNLYAKAASAVSGLPPDYFGLTANEAASADAIRSRESRFVKSVERDQVALGGAREEAMRIAWQLKTKERPDELEQMECLWYDAGTPTYASRVDAVVKMYAATNPAGQSLLPAKMAMEELGWSPAKIDRAMELRDQDAVDPYFKVQQAKDAQAAMPAPAVMPAKA